MLTILNRPAGDWLREEPTATVMRVAWRFSGPLYVTLGAAAALALLWRVLGGRRAVLLFVTGAGVSLGFELAGTTTGLPFGEYHYTPLLGYRILGLVPFPIPVSWFYMLIGCLTMVARRVPARDDSATRWRWALLAAAALVAWDISMDPAMVRTGHWVWGEGQHFRDAGLPAPILAFFTEGAFYGMPLSNWVGWLLSATLIARVMLLVAPPSLMAARLTQTRLPIALYVVNGIMPISLCLRDGLWWAAILGAAAMLIPVVLSTGMSLSARSALRASRSAL
jgi:putative membrane protein